ncbi:UDP-N-acetylmuramate--L-alanine ligase [Pelobacter propionicus]|uniref:UDP-N-acetylmuramate--L-alanine ligase n=1 Tax=Pelobacter propionicus (strain DSM 2379 / NBRC 103807 / OttBd1) TaxID=338966 RepID=MURC_PELPD|nr:UDP-N-acetylmuramate--L-alanine ligase [Pelobacter propionicus]A1AU60.1 RecName: Full=UDP-N-acetylmuramate--L-alanine ligase; AltName: Full=UDP-N-acetylmuramoyl-L-alanine synthetase [Pelobacter propionicus DSM 2379]ABL00881.1 UDP-N-acetylmuramate--L-alanine ligase [Pelobacter propionicus DSM 2379]
MYGKIEKIHFVGIGGIGMSGIAEVLLNLGYKVSGSDLRGSDITERLARLGAEIGIGHKADNLKDVDVVVISSAVHDDNPEVVEAKRLHVPVIPRAEMLAELMRMKFGIAIAGTHGKTTTTSMAASILGHAGIDPTIVIGGKLNAIGTNAQLGQGKFLLAEADESDGSFLVLSPTIAVVTNIDADHLDHYSGGIEEIKDTFVKFINKVPFYGMAVLCLDDPNIRAILPRVKKRYMTYGLSSQADIRATHVRHDGFTTSFTAHFKGYRLGEISFTMPGAHNVLNAMACIAVALELDVPFSAIQEGFSRFGGVGRRFTIKGEPRGITVVDDYGHHPAEIKATLAAARLGWPERRIVAVFQPHRYTRTHELFGEFVTAFYDADVLILTDVYAAGEQPVEGATAERLSQEILRHGQKDVTWIPNRELIPQHLLGIVKEGDMVITLGAGSIWQQGEALVTLLEKTS